MRSYFNYVEGKISPTQQLEVRGQMRSKDLFPFAFSTLLYTAHTSKDKAYSSSAGTGIAAFLVARAKDYQLHRITFPRPEIKISKLTETFFT